MNEQSWERGRRVNARSAAIGGAGASHPWPIKNAPPEGFGRGNKQTHLEFSCAASTEGCRRAGRPEV